MKLKAVFGALAFLGCSFGLVQLVSAQACSGSQGAVSMASTSFSGNNCGNNSNFSAICGNGDTLGGGGMDVITFSLGSTYSNVTFSLTSTGIQLYARAGSNRFAMLLEHYLPDRQ